MGCVNVDIKYNKIFLEITDNFFSEDEARRLAEVLVETADHYRKKQEAKKSTNPTLEQLLLNMGS